MLITFIAVSIIFVFYLLAMSFRHLFRSRKSLMELSMYQKDMVYHKMDRSEDLNEGVSVDDPTVQHMLKLLEESEETDK